MSVVCRLRSISVAVACQVAVAVADALRAAASCAEVLNMSTVVFGLFVQDRGDKSGGLFPASTFCLRLLFIVSICASSSSSSSQHCCQSCLRHRSYHCYPLLLLEAKFWKLLLVFSGSFFQAAFIAEHRACIAFHFTVRSSFSVCCFYFPLLEKWGQCCVPTLVLTSY